MPQHLVSVGTTPVKLCETDPDRMSVVIQNTDGAKTLIVADDSTDLLGSKGTYLYPYGSVLYSKETGDDPRKARYGVSSAASASIAVSEEP